MIEFVRDCKGRRTWIARRKELQERLPAQGSEPDDGVSDSAGDIEEEVWDEDQPTRKANSRIMYIEFKGGNLAGPGRIGRVRFSKTGKSIYYNGRMFQSLAGYRANYCDVETGDRYWISGCKKNGDDTLYPGIIEIDEDVPEEYWKEIRNQPDKSHLTSIRSEGKYSKRRPK